MTVRSLPRDRVGDRHRTAGFAYGTWAGALLLAAGLAGCGLKGPLTMPEKSSNVVVRGPGKTPVPPPAGTVPATPKPAVPKDDRMPPPPLPGGSTGSLHGG